MSHIFCFYADRFKEKIVTLQTIPHIINKKE